MGGHAASLSIALASRVDGNHSWLPRPTGAHERGTAVPGAQARTN